MKILYYDCFSGISGDMNLGAMVDIGVDKTYLINELNKLNLEGWELDIGKEQRHGINGTRIIVRQTRHKQSHRNLTDVEQIINNSDLDYYTKELSSKIFAKVANAESIVHGIPVEKFHFHEVGAVDSIIDIVGAAICYNTLKVDAVHVSVVELGGGFVNTRHGKLPVPAPATAEIIKGIPVKKGGVDFEATTPTGAAIISTLGTIFNSSQPIRIMKIGYGVGQKDHPDVPNLLRIFFGETEEPTAIGHEALQLECNIDDMNPEFFDYISDRLFKSGASDVFFTNIIMKKGRPGIILNVICEKELADVIRSIIFTESTTLGVRSYPFIKETLVRNFETINTIFGPVKVKRSFYKGTEVSFKPEYDECKRIAADSGKPIKEVYNTIIAALEKRRK